jgi:hypothetical protein
MDVLEIIDREDGGVDVDVRFTNKEIEILLQYAISCIVSELEGEYANKNCRVEEE